MIFFFAYGSSQLSSGVQLLVRMFLIRVFSAVASCAQVLIVLGNVYTRVFPKVAVL
jgi:hypothetical protein